VSTKHQAVWWGTPAVVTVAAGFLFVGPSDVSFSNHKRRGIVRPALLRAYRNTCYEAAGIPIRIGKYSAGSDRLLLTHRARSAALITAYNPRSRLMPLAWNLRMQARLLQALCRRRMLPARGFLGRWSEAHLLVFGDPLPVQRLARRYRQNAIVIVRLGQPPRLVMTGYGPPRAPGDRS
jgi:Protein of unknown function (DUF3293)